MAAQEQDVAAAVDDDTKAELLKKINRVLSTVASNVAELTELMQALAGEPGRRRRELDKYGEPTWIYAVKRGIPKDLKLTRYFIEYAAEFGFSQESAQILMNGKGSYKGFIGHYRESGKKWQDWTKVWERWVRTERERKDKAQQQQPTGSATRFDKLRTRG